MNAPRLTKWFLRIFILSIIATALVGAAAIAVPSDDWTAELKVLASKRPMLLGRESAGIIGGAEDGPAR